MSGVKIEFIECVRYIIMNEIDRNAAMLDLLNVDRFYRIVKIFWNRKRQKIQSVRRSAACF